MNCCVTKSPFASNVLRASVFSISVYIGLTVFNSIIPLLTLTNSIKFASSVEVNTYFERVNENLNLSAPEAFSFELPVALSYKLLSSAVDINSSLIVKPTLYEGFALYFSKINNCLSTLQKYPLMYTTPSEIFAIEQRPKGVSVSASTVKSLLLVVSSVTTPLASNPHLTRVSPAENPNELFASVPCLSSLTKRVSLSVVVSAVECITFATTPVV